MAEDDSGDLAADVHPPAPTEAWPPVMGVARVGRRTKDLAKRILPGEIAVIDHEDLDTVATESLIAAGVVAVVNASACISGRYPNAGPLLLPAAGVAVLDGVGPEVIDAIADGTAIGLDGDRILAFTDPDEPQGEEVARGERQDIGTFGVVLEKARTTMGGRARSASPRTRSPTSSARATCSSTSPTSPRSTSTSRAARS